MCIKYVVPENIHTSPKEGYWKYQGMQGNSNTYHNYLEESMKQNRNFQKNWED